MWIQASLGASCTSQTAAAGRRSAPSRSSGEDNTGLCVGLGRPNERTIRKQLFRHESNLEDRQSG